LDKNINMEEIDTGDEVSLIYNTQDDLYYLYCNSEEFLNYFTHQKPALMFYQKVVSLLNEGRSVNWIRTNIFNWESVEEQG